MGALPVVAGDDSVKQTNAIGAFIALMEDEAVLVYEFRGTHYDCGDKLGYLQAQVEFGLKHPELGTEFREYLLRRAL